MEFIEPLLYIGIAQTFFAGLLIATRKPINAADRIISALLFMLFFDLIFALVKIKFIVFYSFPFIAFTYGPLLYFYVRFMTNTGMKFRWINILHFIPFITFFIISVTFRSDRTFTDLTGYLVADRLFSVRIIYGVSFFLSISAYSILAFLEIRNHQKHLKDLVSYTSGVITLNWLKIISISFYVTYIVLFILGGVSIFVQFLPFDPYYTIFIFIAFFSFIYSFYAIKQPVLVGIIVTDDNKNNEEGEASYKRSGLKGNEANTLLKKLIDYVESEKIYLDRDLTIHDLSVATGIPRHHITQVLNENYNRNFFTFINEYRVNEVIERMKLQEYSNYTILAIAYDSGFNSKSTFNSIFKSITGLTPTQYRDKNC